ncbi:MAG: dTDP-4-dehydrorhamnose reductase family protein [Rubripirellula sp.]
MKILVIGGDGMLGHQLLSQWQNRHDVWVTVRRPLGHYAGHELFKQSNTFPLVDVRDLVAVRNAITQSKADAVINCAGIIKQRDEAHQVESTLEVNAIFPHRLQKLCESFDCKLIHLSTDCVFSGKRGNYSQEEPCDVSEVYGLSKYLGELRVGSALTLRTSIIGLEIARKLSLVEWFLAQQGPVRGFTHAIYSGLTTESLGDLMEHILTHHPNLSGLWHAASKPISKYELLLRLSSLLERRDIEIIPDHEFRCNRSLDGTPLERRLGYTVPSWDSMLERLAQQVTHRKMRRLHAA